MYESNKMNSIITKLRLPLSQVPLLKPVASASINKVLAANAWLGSYRISNPSDYLDTFPRPKRWPRKNEIVQPPQTDPNEDKRPATYHHYRANIKQSPKKMWYVMKFIRGMNIDEAIKQCEFLNYKSAQLTADILREVQEIALKKHDFEFKSNMWIEDARCTKGLVIKGLRKHARMRFGTVHYFYAHVMIKLTEGDPPVHFYKPKKDGNDYLKDYYDGLRSRKILQGL